MIETLNSKKKQRIRTLSSMLLPLVIVSFILLFFSSSCRLYKLEQKLDPDNAEFLSRVRYIITSKERKIFLELPDAEKEDFKKEFWERRDPDLSTEENEFKMEYFNCMETSENIFVSEGKPGWLTDRGRIYILFGPPAERITYPMGEDPYGRCREIWYYGNFPVVFVDSTCSGDYHLVTYDLSSIRSLNLMYMHELSMAQARAQDTIRSDRKFIDFDLNVKKTLDEEDRLEGIVTIDIPYADLWFKAEEEILSTVLDLKLELKDAEGTLIWEYEDSFDIEISEQELKESRIKEYNIEIPFVWDKDVDKLRKGKNQFFALIKNRTGGEELRKIREFTF